MRICWAVRDGLRLIISSFSPYLIRGMCSMYNYKSQPALAELEPKLGLASRSLARTPGPSRSRAEKTRKTSPDRFSGETEARHQLDNTKAHTSTILVQIACAILSRGAILDVTSTRHNVLHYHRDRNFTISPNHRHNLSTQQGRHVGWQG